MGRRSKAYLARLAKMALARRSKAYLKRCPNVRKANTANLLKRSQRKNEIKTEPLDDIDVKEEPEVPEEDNFHYNYDNGEGYDLATDPLGDITANSDGQNNGSENSAGVRVVMVAPVAPAFSTVYCASSTATVSVKPEEKHCLLCYQECDPLEHAVENKENVFRAMFLMKKILQVPNHMLEDYLLNVGSPNSWISLCVKCRVNVDEALEIQKQIIQLEGTLRTCQTEIVNTVNKSVACLPETRSHTNKHPLRVTNESRAFVFTSGSSCCASKSITKSKKSRKQTLVPRSDFSPPSPEKLSGNKFSVIPPRKAMPDPVFSSEKSYTCNLCPHLDKMHFHSFAIHILFHHKRAYQCSDCNIYYASPKEVDHSHLNKKRLKEDAAGHICTKDTLFKTKFPPERIWSCEHCSELFDMESQRDVHEQEVHPSKSESSSSHLKHECKTCGRKFRNLKDWSLHRAIEHPEVALLSCYFCDENFGRKTKEGIDVNMGSITAVSDHVKKQHIKNRTTFTMVTCDFCGQNFMRSADLQKHVKEGHGLNPNRAFSCSICFARMNLSNVLRVHLQDVHKAGTQERYVCDSCGYSASRRANFEVHNLETHGIRPERGGVRTCEIEGCTFEYLYKGYFDRHMIKVHNAARKHMCQFCGKGFLNGNQHREHERIHLNKADKPFKCKICGNSFALRNYLYIHMRLSHLNRPFASTNKKRPNRKGLNQRPSEAIMGKNLNSGQDSSMVQNSN